MQLPPIMRCFVRLMADLSPSTHPYKFIIVDDYKQNRHGFRFALNETERSIAGGSVGSVMRARAESVHSENEYRFLS